MGFLDKACAVAEKVVSGYLTAQELANGAISVLIDSFGDLVKIFSNEIKNVIKEKLKKTILKNFFNLILCAIALSASFFVPNKMIATYITSIILLFVLSLSIIRIIKVLIKNSFLICCLFKKKFKLFDTIVYYVSCTKGKAANIAVKTLDCLAKVNRKIGFIKKKTINRLKWQVIKSAFGIAKIMIADIVFFCVYMIIMSKVVKPLLFDSMAGLTQLQLYIYPFVNSIDLIFHTSLCQMFGINI